MAVSFSGGMRLKNRKKHTSGAKLSRVLSCKNYVFPLAQTISEPLKPLVSIGEYVRAGQKIADLEDYFAVPVHSSVSGIVTAIDDNAITIESDGQFYSTEPPEITDSSVYTTRELLWLIRDAGIIAPDGEPAHIKLNPQKSVRFIIANCAESDLYITAKQELIENHSKDIISGLKTAMRILNLKEAYIGVEAHMKNGFNALKKEIRYDLSMNLLKLKSKYPQSDETQLIKAVTGLDTPVGSVVVDARTLYEISQAVNHRKSVTERIVTVAGDSVNSPSNYIVPLGVPLSFLIEQSGGITDNTAKVLINGVIKGYKADINAPLSKTISAVIAVLDNQSENPDAKCGLCRKCIGKCPMRINPKLLSNTSDMEKAEDNFILDCTECGLCSYICPKRRNPMEKIVTLKNQKGGS